MDLIKDENFLRQVSKPVSVAKGLKIGRDMHNFLLTFNKVNRVKAVGLSAIQVGILVQVFITNISGNKRTFINPQIVKHSLVQIPFKEGCLSFPNIEIDTYRYPWVVVSCDNVKSDYTFGNYGCNSDSNLLEAVLAQHEIDHLKGILFKDRTKDLTENYEGFRLGMSDANPYGLLG